MRWGENGGRFKREGTYVHLGLIHIVVWQKPIQYCKAIILQLKKKKAQGEGGRGGRIYSMTKDSTSKAISEKDDGIGKMIVLKKTHTI